MSNWATKKTIPEEITPKESVYHISLSERISKEHDVTTNTVRLIARVIWKGLVNINSLE